MWKTIADWVLAFFGMARELEEHRTTIRGLEDRIRNLEEALKLLAQEQGLGAPVSDPARSEV